MNDIRTPLAAGSNSSIDAAAAGAEQAIRSSQRVAHQAVDRLAEGMNDVRAQTGAALDGLAGNAERIRQRSLSAVRDGTRRLRERSLDAADTTRGYIRDEPMKSVLIAAAVGAAMMGLITVFGRSRRDDR